MRMQEVDEAIAELFGLRLRPRSRQYLLKQLENPEKTAPLSLIAEEARTGAPYWGTIDLDKLRRRLAQ